MKIPTWILSTVLLGGVGWLAWMSVEIIALKVNVSRIDQRLADISGVKVHSDVTTAYGK